MTTMYIVFQKIILNMTRVLIHTRTKDVAVIVNVYMF